MRRCLLALVLVLSLAGCFETDTIIRVHTDGSGTIEQTFVMSKAALEQMRVLGGEMGVGEDFDPLDEARLEAQAARLGEGVRLVSAEPLSSPDGEGYRAVYAFDDVTTLRLSSGGPDLEESPTEAIENPITFAFVPGTEDGAPATLTIIQPDFSEPDSAEAAQRRSRIAEIAADSTEMAALREQAAVLLEGMRLRMSVAPQDSVRETSATFHDDGRIVLFDVDMSLLMERPEKLAALQVSGARTPAEMQHILADISGLRIEPQRTVTVIFE